MNVMNNDKETRSRTCRACNESYDYPVPKSPATRFYCPTCAELSAEVRAMFEKYNRRIKALTTQVEKLEKALTRAAGDQGGSAKSDS